MVREREREGEKGKEKEGEERGWDAPAQQGVLLTTEAIPGSLHVCVIIPSAETWEK